ncbi:hypothetical protein RN001_002572 [Aquatica leii]|uniref:Uncharacterized protein n=1 Tax=Aquatica leii TaxID=1421715 RepID=A0AAN7PMJ4_9COLE|nr:hypothetical protein RN001_002572 [Aquatica leii]
MKAREARRKSKYIKRKLFPKTDGNYGPDVVNFVADLEQNLYQEKVKTFLHDLHAVDKQKIFQETVLQYKSNFWQTERKKRITSSSFGKICSVATKFGLENEEIAISLFEKQLGKLVQKKWIDN